MQAAQKNAFFSSVVTEKTFEAADVPDEVECPFELLHVWEWFLELDKTRPNNGMGISAITHTEITSWADGMNIELLPFERKAIRAVDEAYVTYCNSKAKENDREH